MDPSFEGRVTVRTRFRSKADYQKFRKYILKTDWSYDLAYPEYEQITLDFHNTEDVESINRSIIALLQMGFEVYCCKYQLEEHLAAEQHPTEEDQDAINLEEFNVNKILDHIWEESQTKHLLK